MCWVYLENDSDSMLFRGEGDFRFVFYFFSPKTHYYCHRRKGTKIPILPTYFFSSCYLRHILGLTDQGLHVCSLICSTILVTNDVMHYFIHIFNFTIVFLCLFKCLYIRPKQLIFAFSGTFLKKPMRGGGAEKNCIRFF